VDRPPELAGRDEEPALVEAAIAVLGERPRALVLLRHYAGAPWREIAAELDFATERAARVAHATALIELGAALRRRGLSG
jgi:DNA-directed RNA polymerase specialized sigma24 family protein